MANGLSGKLYERLDKPILLHLPTGLEYSGCLDIDNLPKGHGTIRRGSSVIVEGYFDKGLPSGSFCILNNQGDRLILAIDSNGLVKKCKFSSSN